jgi:transcriptional regulator with XRE-family HTH domain
VIGELIRQLREQRKVSVEALADAATISVESLSRIEGAAAFPRLSTLRKVADALALQPSILIEQLRHAEAAPLFATEEVPGPISELRDIGASQLMPALAELEARDALQRVADDVIVRLLCGQGDLLGYLGQLSEQATGIQGSIEPEGKALGGFIDALRENFFEQRFSSDMLEAVNSANELIERVFTDYAAWTSEFEYTSGRYAAILLNEEPSVFRDAVSRFLENFGAVLAGVPLRRTSSQQEIGRREISALLTVLTLFDLVNGFRDGLGSETVTLASGVRMPA